MSRLSLIKSLVLVLLSLVVLGGCGGSGGVDSEHDLVPTPEVPTDTNTTPEDNTTTPTVRLSALKLTAADTTLNKDHNTTLTLTATYDDNTTKPLTSPITWIITPQDALTIHGHTLTALKDTNVTVQAKVGTTLSNKVKLNIYWEVNGHRLPPEPDPKVNNATLLGVDINKNGVRDDVERWIYEKYKDKHPIYIDIAMQAGRAYKLVLEHPEKAKEIYPEVDKAADCEAYYKFDADELNDKILVHETIDDKNFRHNIYFNTKERMKTYLKYDTLLSGDTYVLPSPEKEKAACDFDTSKYEE